MSPINDNLRAPPEHPTPFFRGLAFGFAAELVGAALIFGAAYIWWMVTP